MLMNDRLRPEADIRKLNSTAPNCCVKSADPNRSY